MRRDNRSATAPASILEMFSVMLLSALLVGMMYSESIGKSFQLGPSGCGRPQAGCNRGCARTTSNVQDKECAGGCASDAQCKNCSCRLKPKDPSKTECWCQ